MKNKQSIRTILFSVLFLFAFSSVLKAQWNDFNLSDHPWSDTEPSMAINPINANNIIAAWMHVSSLSGLSIQTKASLDGGATWSAAVSLPHISPNFTSADVSICFNKTGTAFLAYVDYKLSIDSGYARVVKSSDGGLTWSSPVNAISSFDAVDFPVDRPWIAVDKSNGPYSGRLYLVTKSYYGAAPPHHIWLSKSDDDGNTWTPIQMLDVAVPIDLLTNIMAVHTVGASGNLYISYFSYSPSISIFVRAVCLESTNGGSTFTAKFIGNVPAGSALTDTLYQGSYSIHANPIDSNNLIYQVVNNSNGDPDVFVSYSNNKGNTWTALKRVNDDGLSNGKGQDMSWGEFSSDGKFVMAWRDRRNYGSGASVNFDVYASVSLDGGQNFSNNYMLSNSSSPVIPISRGNDFLGVCAGGGMLHSVWSDSRLGNNETYAKRILISDLLSMQQTIQNEHFVLKIFPNPASDQLHLEFSKEMKGRIEIYDVSGKKILQQETNSKKETIALQKFPAGLYWLQMNTKEETLRRKFVVSRPN